MQAPSPTHTVLILLQLHLRLELEIERMKQLHQKELEDKEEELEDVRQSCQKRVRMARVCYPMHPFEWTLRPLAGRNEGACD